MVGALLMPMYGEAAANTDVGVALGVLLELGGAE